MGIYRDIMALNPPKQVTPPNNEVIAFSKGYLKKKTDHQNYHICVFPISDVSLIHHLVGKLCS